MIPLMHSTAGMPEKKGILSLRTAVTSSLTEDGGERLAVAVAYVLSGASLDSIRGGREGRGKGGRREGERKRGVQSVS